MSAQARTSPPATPAASASATPAASPSATPAVSVAPREKVAVIGIGCRFPGGANDHRSFWRNLVAGKDCITPTPADRYDAAGLGSRDKAKPGRLVGGRGGYIDGFDEFDPAFFGISPREAHAMDPQQRKLLEVAWEALEDGGQKPGELAGRDVGVFVGAFTLDYKILQFSDLRFDTLEAHTATGTMMTMVSNRLSHCFDFRGPSLSIDSACSSSLVAVHLACESLRRGESALALAGGTLLHLAPQYTIAETKGGFLSPEGRSRTFDAGANGYVRAEGVGIVALKLLTDAVRDGDPIHAVITETGVNQDGRTHGITVPSADAQTALIQQVCARAGITPGSLQYVEAHGTSTPVGDPIEANALARALAVGREPGAACYVGSVKTNIGHTESAAGIAGLIKTALSLEHRLIPPHINLERVNPAIDLDAAPYEIPDRLTPWPAHEGPARAGVNSFGFGGTNAHVLLEEAPVAAGEAPPTAWVAPAAGGLPFAVLPLSAHDASVLPELAESVRADVTAQGSHHGPALTDSALTDLAHSLACRRQHHDARLSVVYETRDDLDRALAAYVRGEEHPRVLRGRRREGQQDAPAWVFTGMGPQWWAMGRELFTTSPVYREAVEAVDREIAAQAGWSLTAELNADEDVSRMAQTWLAQPANFAVQVGLAALWRAQGVRPAAIVGHSTGEVAAFYEAGVYSLPDAVRIVLHRSRLQHRLAGAGTMLAVGLPEAEAARRAAPFGDRLSVAAVNSPGALTLAGDREALAAYAEPLRAEGVFTKFLDVEVPYHSAAMEEIKAELLAELAGIDPRPARVPLHLTGRKGRAEGPELDAGYWWDNVRDTVRFRDAVDALLDEGHRTFLEIGPHPVLGHSIKECFAARDAREGDLLTDAASGAGAGTSGAGASGASGAGGAGASGAGSSGASGAGGPRQTVTALPSIRRAEGEALRFATSLASLYTLGCAVDWEALHPRGRWVPPPRYPWKRDRYWTEPAPVAQVRLGRVDHPLLGRRLATAEPAWEVALDVETTPYLADHRIQGRTLFPAAGYVEMAYQAVRALTGGTDAELADVELRKALFLPDDAPRAVQLSLSAQTSAFTVATGGDTPAVHACGVVRGGVPVGRTAALDGAAVRARADERLDSAACYETLSAFGYEYGPAFQGIAEVWRTRGEALALIRPPAGVGGAEGAGGAEDAAGAGDAGGAGGHHVHPALLDACFQALLVAGLADADAASGGGMLLPLGIEAVRTAPVGDRALWAHATVTRRAGDELVGDIALYMEDGEPLGYVRGFRAADVEQASAAVGVPTIDSWLAELTWTDAPLEDERDEVPREGAPDTEAARSPRASGTWLLFADRPGGVADRLAALAGASGARCHLVRPGDGYAFDREGRESRVVPDSADDLRRLLADLADVDAEAAEAAVADRPALDTIVHLWNLDLPALEDTGRGDLHAHSTLGAYSVVALAQALQDTPGQSAAPAALHLVTRGAQAAVPGDRVEPLGAPVWGIGRVLRHQELTAHGGKLIDLPLPSPDLLLTGSGWEPAQATEPQADAETRGTTEALTAIVPQRPHPDTGARGATWTPVEAGTRAEAGTPGEAGTPANGNTPANAGTPANGNTPANAVVHATTGTRSDAAAQGNAQERVNAGAKHPHDTRAQANAQARPNAAARAGTGTHGDTGTQTGTGTQTDPEVRLGTSAQGNAEARNNTDTGTRTDTEVRYGTSAQRDAEARSNTGAQTDPDTRSVTKVRAAPEAQAGIGPEGDAEARADTEAEPATEANADAETQAGTGVKADAGAQAHAETRGTPGARAGIGTQACAHARLATGAQAVTGAGVDTKARTDAAARAHAETQGDTGAQAGTGAQAVTGAGVDTKARTDAAARADAETQGDTGAQAGAGDRADAAAQAATQAGSDTEAWRDANSPADAEARATAHAQADAAALLREILAPAAPGRPQDEVALRGRRRLVSGLSRASGLTRPFPPRLRTDGAYLVTGAFGALGRLLCRYLVRRGARHLILVGRTELPGRATWRGLDPGSPAADAVGFVKELEALGAHPVHAALDVSDERALARWLAGYRDRDAPPVRGVFHLAGHVRDTPVHGLDRPAFDSAFDPKAAGAWLLHHHLRDEPLDHFVLFASVASLLTTTGQANYAAGNAFLDALAHHRRSRGLPALSLDWGPWATGMIEELSLVEHYRTVRGMSSLSPSAGMAVLERVLGQDRAQLLIATVVDWKTFLAWYPSPPPLVRRLAAEAAAPTAPGETATRTGAPDEQSAYLDRFRAAAGDEERARLVADRFLGCASSVLRMSADQLDPDTGLGTYGIDSLLAMELRARVQAATGVALPVVALLSGAPLRELTAQLLAGTEALASQAGSGPGDDTAVEVHQDASRHPLTQNQKALWFLKQLHPDGFAYNIGGAVEVRTAIDPGLMAAAVRALVARHPVLRANFVMEDGRPLQTVSDAVEPDFEVFDVEGMEWEGIRELIVEEYRRPYDLARDRLMRFRLFRRGPDRWVLMKAVHHIVSDAISTFTFIEELLALYEGMRTGQVVELPPVRGRYVDFLNRQNRFLASPDADRMLEYWRGALPAEVPPLTLHTDAPRPPVQTHNGASEFFVLDPELSARVHALARAHDVTVFMVLLCAYYLLLHRHSGQDDIVVGSPVTGRTDEDLSSVYGYFVNPLPLYANLGGDPTVADLLAQVRGTVLGGIDHQEYPFVLLVEKLGLQHDPSRSAVFQAMFILLAHKVSSQQYGYHLDYIELPEEEGQFDLTLSAYEDEAEHRFHCVLKYNTDLFRPETARRLAGHYRNLLDALTRTPGDRPAGELDMLGEDERHEILHGPAARGRVLPPEPLVHDLFVRAAERTPDAVAVTVPAASPGGLARHLTYAELERASGTLAGRLRARGASGGVVAVCLPKSPELIVALLGVLRAGAAYLPLDPDHPAERLAFMAGNADARLVLTDPGCAGQLDVPGAEFLTDVMAGDPESPAAGAGADTPAPTTEAPTTDTPDTPAPADPPVGPDTLAYVIHTSGSTGRPKAVRVSHGALAALGAAWREEYELAPEAGRGPKAGPGPDSAPRVHLQMAGVSFDVFTGDLVRALCSGGRLVLADRELLLNTARLYEAMITERVTCAEFVPAVVRALMTHCEEGGHRLDFMRLLIVGSDTWKVAEYERLRGLCGPDTRVLNSYGLTEATVDSACFEGPTDGLDPNSTVPIGGPLPNCVLHVLDARRQPAPTGVTGELWAGGAGLAQGYAGDPEQTGERFVTLTLDRGPDAVPERLYRTGDLARRDARGRIHLLGRADAQIKLRGHRIEPGEIESLLTALPEVADAYAMVRTDHGGEPALCAYVVRAPGTAPDPRALRRHLAAHLPTYLIPARLHTLDALPLNANGKVDPDALPVPAAESAQEHHEPPVTLYEERVAAHWKAVIGLEQIGLHSDFFESGGSSITLIELIHRLQKEFGIAIPVGLLFKVTTLHGMARTVEDIVTGRVSGNLSHLSFNTGAGPVVFCFPPAGGHGLVYRHFAAHLPSYELIAFNHVDGDKSTRYADLVDSLHPEGPCLLLGYSLGGNLAFEVAKRLEQRGREVAHVVIMDSYRIEERYGISAEHTEAFERELRDHLRRHTHSETVTAQTLEQARDYLEYCGRTPNHGSVAATVTVISDEAKAPFYAAGRPGSWHTTSTTASRLVRGAGLHAEMLDEKPAERNAALVLSALGGDPIATAPRQRSASVDDGTTDRELHGA